ncbi:MAG: hypothetical protein ACR2PG_16150, partial [Hyphomicrobiaceae bacterium]
QEIPAVPLKPAPWRAALSAKYSKAHFCCVPVLALPSRKLDWRHLISPDVDHTIGLDLTRH